MAIKPSDEFPGQVLTTDPTGYPQGKARNVTVPGDGTGTPWEERVVNDIWGFQQALLDAAGLTPSGTPDKVGASQYLQALLDITVGTFETLTHLIGDAVFSGKNLDVSGQTGFAEGLTFKPDGTKLYVTGGTGNGAIFQYGMSTAWDLSTASYDSVSFSTVGEDASPKGIYFKPDGTKLYMVGSDSDEIHQYSMSTPWDLSTLADDAVPFSVAAQDTFPSDVFVSPDGENIYVVGLSGATVERYTLSTPWDLSTAAHDSTTGVGPQASTPSCVQFTPDGKRMFVGNQASDAIFQYTLGTAWDIATKVYDQVSFSVAAWETSLDAIAFSTNGKHLYAVGKDSDAVYQFHASRVVPTAG